MLDNCKSCLFYSVEYDEMWREEDDALIINDPNPNPHFCTFWEQGIPKDIWHNKTKCPHFVVK